MELGPLPADHTANAQPVLDPPTPRVGGPPQTLPSVLGSTAPRDDAERPRQYRSFRRAVSTYLKHGADLVCSERINCLLVFVPIGITVGFLDVDPILDFILNTLAIIPLAVVISTATENLASRLGDTFGALLNVTVGNTAELMIFFVALNKNQIRIVQASLLGSLVTNLLLILATALVCGGVRYQDQLRDRPAVRLSVVLLNIGLLISIYPTAFWKATTKTSDANFRRGVLALSRGTSFVLIFLYLLYLTLQMRAQRPSHPGSMPDSEAFPLSTIPSRLSGPKRPGRSTGTPGRPDVKNLGSGVSNSRWSSWASTLLGRGGRERYQSTGQTHDPSISLLQGNTSVNDFELGSEEDGLDDDDDDDDDDEAGQVVSHSQFSGVKKTTRNLPSAFTERRAQERASGSLTHSAVSDTNNAEAVRAVSALSGALPPSPPSTIASPFEAESEPSRGRTRLSVSYVDGPAVLPRHGINPQLLRRNTFRDLHEHRRSRSRQSQTPLIISLLVLTVSAIFASVCSELAVGAIPSIVESWGISEILIGFIILPIVGNAAEHVTAAKLAMHNRFVLAKSVAVESSTQIVLLITPAMILLGWARNRELTLQFDIYGIASVAIASTAASLVVSCGKGNWKQGVLLYTIFGIIALGAIFYPMPPKLFG